MTTQTNSDASSCTERMRLAEDAARTANWKRWGPYLSERQWATVREDYSADGDAWGSFPHDHARSRAYRWGEDGLLGLCDRQCRLCFAVALWNERDAILKERLFGLTGPEGNHGEDVKEEYFYLDSTPTHSYMRALYRYPQHPFPYTQLLDGNRARGLDDPEFELADTGVFAEDRFFDVTAEYAKAAPDDIAIRLTVRNRGPEPASIRVLPTLWFRNTWSWGCRHEGCSLKPRIRTQEERAVLASHETLGDVVLKWSHGPKGEAPEPLFTENETNHLRLYGVANASPYVKDAFHRHVVDGETGAVHPERVGTKMAVSYRLDLAPGETAEIRLRLVDQASSPSADLEEGYEKVFQSRQQEADTFYEAVLPRADRSSGEIARQAYAGLLWSKQFYHYIVSDWMEGDPGHPPPPSRYAGRNAEWGHVYARDVLSVPDVWEYPWFAAWDTAFHMVPFARIDPAFAKQQLLLFLREWYMHPNGQMPAYDFAFGDVNPPVHAWAAWQVYRQAAGAAGGDREFLERMFQKLLLNFTWWVNRKDREGHNLFSGGFLGLDNIGVFDRSQPLPTGGALQQADATGWMAFYALTMMRIAMELVLEPGGLRVAYGDMASKFFEHFVQICDAMNAFGGDGLWDETDGFYYDRIRVDGGAPIPLRVRSMVGLLPLIAAVVIEEEQLERLPGFRKRFDWFLQFRHDLARHISVTEGAEAGGRRRWLLAVFSRERLLRVLGYLLDENEFLAPFGIRSLSRVHRDHPFILHVGAEEFRVDYVPGVSNSRLFGGNSNWRGPIWFPVNILLIEALERYHDYYGESLRVECPTGSGTMMNLREVAAELSRRLAGLFLPGADGHRVWAGAQRFRCDAAWRDLHLFHEYFDGDSGEGLGASHQTGWTALCVNVLEEGVR